MTLSGFTMALRNLTQRPLRTVFTAAGISIGIAAIISIVGISKGMEAAWKRALEVRGTDVVISGKAEGMVPGLIDMQMTERVAGFEGVEAATGVLWLRLGIEDASMVVVSGREWGGFGWSNIKVIEGRMPASGTEKAVVLGETVADMLNKEIGDTVQIELDEFSVVGIFDGGAVAENASIAVSLPLLQDTTGTPGKVNFVNVRLRQPVNEATARELCDQIESQVEGIRATLASETLASNRSFKMIRAGSWATTLLAIMAGVFGVMNTMLMSVFERTHEIGVLSAIGWRRRRIVSVIMLESVVLSLMGFLCGAVMGTAMLAGLGRSPMLRGSLEPYVGLDLLLISFAISLFVGVLSGIYPAWKGAKTSPGVALRTA